MSAKLTKLIQEDKDFLAKLPMYRTALWQGEEYVSILGVSLADESCYVQSVAGEYFLCGITELSGFCL